MAFRIETPAGYSSTVPSPLVIMSHPNNSDKDTMFTGSYAQMVTAFKAAGYICAAADQGNNWGAQAGVNASIDLYATVAASYNVGPVLLFSGSMGGSCSLNVVMEDAVPKVCAWAAVYPVCNLANSYAGSFTTAINTAYNIPTGGTYAAQTAGHDPNLAAAAAFNALPMRFYASPSDVTVPKASHTDLLAATVAATAPEATVVVCSGVHGDGSHFQPADTVAFFQRSIAAVVPPAISRYMILAGAPVDLAYA